MTGVSSRPAASEAVSDRESTSTATEKRGGRGSDTEPASGRGFDAEPASAIAAQRGSSKPSLRTEDFDTSLANLIQSGIDKGSTAGHIDGSDPTVRAQITPRSSSGGY